MCARGKILEGLVTLCKSLNYIIICKFQSYLTIKVFFMVAAGWEPQLWLFQSAYRATYLSDGVKMHAGNISIQIIHD